MFLQAVAYRVEILEGTHHGIIPEIFACYLAHGYDTVWLLELLFRSLEVFVSLHHDDISVPLAALGNTEEVSLTDNPRTPSCLKHRLGSNEGRIYFCFCLHGRSIHLSLIHI